MSSAIVRQVEPELTPYSLSPPGVKPSWSIYCGDARKVANKLPEESVNCVVTSPPYYWQRDYGVEGQLGMEATIDGYVENLVQVFAGLWNALRPDGVMFLNLGDTYYNAKGKPHGRDDKHRGRHFARQQLRAVDGPGLGLPRKSLIGIPWRVALALAESGWTLRADIIWVRRSAMPEPTAIDRPWRQHEHLFLLTKGPRYYFDREVLGAEEDVWHIEPERHHPARGAHYAPYPRNLVERCLAAGCPADGTVLDPFAGGGTTLLVAQQRRLNSVGIELNSDFCAVMDTGLRENVHA